MVLWPAAILIGGASFCFVAEWTPEGTVLVISAIATILIPSIIALVRLLAALFEKAKASEKILVEQDKALNRIETVLREKFETMANHIKSEYDKALQRISEEARVQRHDSNNQIMALKFENKELESKLEAKRAKAEEV